MPQAVVLNSVDEVFGALRLSNTSLFGDQTSPGWLFRGHADPDWTLTPSVWRKDFLDHYRRPNALFPKLIQDALRIPIEVNPWVEVLQLCPDARARLPELLERLLTEYTLVRAFFIMANDLALTDNKRAWPHFGSRLKPTAATLLDEPDLAPHTIAQHYGVPTRLLDWTRDPLTALAFALEGAENSSELTIWAFDHKVYLAQAQNWLQPGEHSLHIYEGGGRENSYLHAQRGAFTYIHRGEVTYLGTGTYPTVDQIVPDFMFKRFSIPVTPEAKVHLAVGLIRERRTRAHLMPNLSSCAEVAVSTFRLGLNF